MDARLSKICLEICVELSKCWTPSSQEPQSAVSQAMQSIWEELDKDYDVLTAKCCRTQECCRDPDMDHVGSVG